jgi:hypothetical protein
LLDWNKFPQIGDAASLHDRAITVPLLNGAIRLNLTEMRPMQFT